MRGVLKRSLTVALAANVIAWGVPGSAHALAVAPEEDESSDDASSGDDEADELQALYDRALAAYAEQNFVEAIAAFKEAYQIEQEPNLLYNIYRAYDKLDQPEEALPYLDQYAEVADESEQADLAEKRADLVRRIEANKAADTGNDAEDERRRGTDRIYGPASWALTAAAVAGLAVGIGFTVSAAGKRTESEDDCAETPSGTICGAEGAKLRDEAANHAIGGFVGFGIAGAATVAIITIVAVKASRKKKNKKSAMLMPYGTSRTFGLSLTGRF